MTDIPRITVNDGKYTVIVDNSAPGTFRALRYGEEWRDLTGDGLVLSLCHAILDLQERLEEIENNDFNRGVE
jgi:hypothetical protein